MSDGSLWENMAEHVTVGKEAAITFRDGIKYTGRKDTRIRSGVFFFTEKTYGE